METERGAKIRGITKERRAGRLKYTYVVNGEEALNGILEQERKMVESNYFVENGVVEHYECDWNDNFDVGDADVQKKREIKEASVEVTEQSEGDDGKRG